MMKKKLLNIGVYSMLGWSILSAGYLILPVEIQNMIPQMNWFTALISGGSTFLLGSGGLFITNMLNKSKLETIDKFATIITHYIEMKTAYNEMKASTDENNILLKRTNLLIEADLKAKLDNPMISDATRELIEGVLNDKEG